LSRRRDIAAARRFFSRATKQHGAPRVITLDGYAATHRAVAKLENLRNLTAPRTGAILQIPEQRDRARSSANKATNRSRCSGSNDSRAAAVTIRGIPVSRENQKTSVQPQTTNRKSNHRSGNVGRGPGRLKSANLLARQNTHLRKFAPEPKQDGSGKFGISRACFT
jgi:transposase-like protein